MENLEILWELNTPQAGSERPLVIKPRCFVLTLIPSDSGPTPVPASVAENCLLALSPRVGPAPDPDQRTCSDKELE